MSSLEEPQLSSTWQMQPAVSHLWTALEMNSGSDHGPLICSDSRQGHFCGSAFPEALGGKHCRRGALSTKQLLPVALGPCSVHYTMPRLRVPAPCLLLWTGTTRQCDVASS